MGPDTSQRDRLKTFLSDTRRPEGTFTYHQLQGFLFATLSAPELIHPHEWLPVIFADGEPGADEREAQAVLGAIMALYNGVNEAILADGDAIPADCAIRDDPMANFEAEAPIGHWAQGFLAGYDWLIESWEPYLEEEDEPFGALLMVLGFFSSRTFAQGLRDEMESKQSLEQLAALVHGELQNAAREFAWFGRSIAAAIAEAEQQAARKRPNKGKAAARSRRRRR